MKTQDIRNLFRRENVTTAIKDRVLKDIKNTFESEKEEKSYYNLTRVSGFWSNNYIEYESSTTNRNKTLST